MSRSNILLTIASLTLIYLIGSSSYHYGIKLLSYPQTKAAAKHSRPPYLTRKERDGYKEYLMEQEDETNFMLWGEWKLSKVFSKTLTQLEKEQNLEPLGPIAQRLEQTTHNRLVGGSNPSRPTISPK